MKENYGPFVLRLGLGILFFIPGLQKLANPGMIIGMLDGMGVPLATLMGWVLLLSEIVFGASILVGWKLKKTVWPLAVIMAIALFAVHVPAWMSGAPMALISVLFHLVGIAGLISLYYSGAGAYAVKN